VLILLFLFTLALAIAAPSVAKSIQRDKEEEAVRRGDQYKRAIRKYYKKFNTYPTSVAQLENTNEIRFLRKRYLNPLTGKDDWRLIHVGQAKVPVMGFFGQPLQAGASSVTTGVNGNGTSGFSGGSSSPGSAGGLFSGSGTPGSGAAGSGTGSGDGSGAPAAPVGVLPGMGGGVGSTAPTGTAGGTTTSTSGTTTGVFGDGAIGPIVGVGIALDKKSLVIYHKQDAYNKWEFTYDPIEEQMYSGNGGMPQPASGNNNAAGIGNSGFGPTSGTSTNPSGFSNQGNNPNGGTPAPGTGTTASPNGSTPNPN
jgi:type II secretory pathway pseudopilin PulG